MTGLGRGKAIVVRMSSSTKDVGFSSTVLATVFSIIYFVGQLAEWAGLLGSQGGPSSSSTPLGLVLLLSPAFFLGSSFLVMVVSIHQFASSDKRSWGHTAVVFASARAILVSTVYFVQLTLAAPRAARGRVAGIEGLLFVPFDSVLYAVNILSYNFMRVGTSFAVPVFTGGRSATSGAPVTDSERATASLHRAAIVLPPADMGRSAVGGDVSRIDLDSGRPLWTSGYDRTGVAVERTRL